MDLFECAAQGQHCLVLTRLPFMTEAGVVGITAQPIRPTGYMRYLTLLSENLLASSHPPAIL
jgi:hypothetical protein